MKLQVGDIVRYLNDVGGGVVQKIINATQVEILDNSGFTLPIFEKDLVLIERPTAKTKQPEDQVVPLDVFEEVESEDIEGNDTPLVYLAFVRDAKNPNMFDSYIIICYLFCQASQIMSLHTVFLDFWSLTQK